MFVCVVLVDGADVIVVNALMGVCFFLYFYKEALLCITRTCIVD